MYFFRASLDKEHCSSRGGAQTVHFANRSHGGAPAPPTWRAVLSLIRQHLLLFGLRGCHLGEYPSTRARAKQGISLMWIHPPPSGFAAAGMHRCRCKRYTCSQGNSSLGRPDFGRLARRPRRFQKVRRPSSRVPAPPHSRWDCGMLALRARLLAPGITMGSGISLPSMSLVWPPLHWGYDRSVPRHD